MGKYLMLWEMDLTKFPISPKERGAAYVAAMKMVMADLKKGALKDWGAFVGEHHGYAIVEGTELEVENLVEKYTPQVIFKVHPIASADNVVQVSKALAK